MIPEATTNDDTKPTHLSRKERRHLGQLLSCAAAQLSALATKLSADAWSLLRDADIAGFVLSDENTQQLSALLDASIDAVDDACAALESA